MRSWKPTFLNKKQNIQQIEVYKGSSGAHFGPSAIAGAINFITAIDYEKREARVNVFIMNEKDEVVSPGTAAVEFSS